MPAFDNFHRMSKYKNVYEIWLMGFESLLQWGIDRFAQANAVGVAETGAEGGSHRLTDEVSITVKFSIPLAHRLNPRPPTLLCGRADNACTNLLGFLV